MVIYFYFIVRLMRGLKNQTNKTINYIDYIKPKRKSQPIIKSQGYRKKYEQGLPKLGDKKEIPFHNLYGVSVAANQLEKQNQPDPWATMSKDIRKNRLNNPQTCRNQAHTTFYDVFIQKYIHKNRKITRTKQEKKQFKTSSLKFHQPKIVFEYRKKSKSALQYVNQNTQQRLNEQKINNLFLSQKQPLILLQSTTGYGKSFKDMTLQQLRQGLTWKKTFLQELEKRKQQNRGKSFRKELNTVNFIIRKACQLDKVEEY